MPQKANHYYFLASPYNGSPEEKKYRHGQSQKVVAYFLKHKISVFAPILYNQAILHASDDLSREERRELLMPMNINFLYGSAGALILKIEGWDTSWGMQRYKEICHENKIPSFELNPSEMEKTLCMIKQPDKHLNQNMTFKELLNKAI